VLELDRAADLDVLSEQLEAAVATAPCSCPCPSVTLEVDRARAKPVARRGHRHAAAEWDRGGISVQIAHGWLYELEIWWYMGDAPLAFPPLTRIRPFEGYRGSAASGPSEHFRGTFRRILRFAWRR
jgi:hypothetical protein